MSSTDAFKKAVKKHAIPYERRSENIVPQHSLAFKNYVLPTMLPTLLKCYRLWLLFYRLSDFTDAFKIVARQYRGLAPRLKSYRRRGRARL